MNVKRGYLDFSDDICMRWNSTDGLENYLLEADDILIQMDGALIGKSYAKIAEEQLPALLVQRVTRARTRSKDACADFMYQTIQRDFLRYIGMNKTETAVPHLSLNDIYNFKIMVPCLEEQQQIGAYFSNIDNLITLHQRKDVFLFIKGQRGEPMNKPSENTIAWEQRKVSETAEIVAGGTPSTSVSEYWEPKEVPWLSSGEVHKKYITYTDDMISKLGLSNSNAKMIKENSILIALAGQGKTRGTVAINRISLSTNQSIAAMTFNDDIIPEFVFSNLENRYDEIRAMSSGDGSRGGLNKQLVGNIVIPYTIIEEQRKIGAYFENLDNLITLHQRKLFCSRKRRKYHVKRD